MVGEDHLEKQNEIGDRKQLGVKWGGWSISK